VLPGEDPSLPAHRILAVRELTSTRFTSTSKLAALKLANTSTSQGVELAVATVAQSRSTKGSPLVLCSKNRSHENYPSPGRISNSFLTKKAGRFVLSGTDNPLPPRATEGSASGIIRFP
jgi:hypothetical protein